MSSRIAPIEVVKLLNGLFGRFDKLVDKYDLNKVKTIGDCYMVTSIPCSKSPAAMAAAVCAFGLDMLDELHDYINATATATTRSSQQQQQQQQQGSSEDGEGHEQKPLELRVGINSGPVVAGIIGTKRYMYDIWGDSVNVASRMESTGVPGKIQATREVVELVEPFEGGEAYFTFVKRGLVDVKGKGRIETYFLENRVAI
jgi:adenylate cyclase